MTSSEDMRPLGGKTSGLQKAAGLEKKILRRGMLFCQETIRKRVNFSLKAQQEISKRLNTEKPGSNLEKGDGRSYKAIARATTKKQVFLKQAQQSTKGEKTGSSKRRGKEGAALKNRGTPFVNKLGVPTQRLGRQIKPCGTGPTKTKKRETTRWKKGRSELFVFWGVVGCLGWGFGCKGGLGGGFVVIWFFFCWFFRLFYDLGGGGDIFWGVSDFVFFGERLLRTGTKLRMAYKRSEKTKGWTARRRISRIAGRKNLPLPERLQKEKKWVGRKTRFSI